jgi:uncharacterized protein
MANVYFSPKFDSVAIGSIFKMALDDVYPGIMPDDRVALKLHFGEEGNTRYVKPEQVRPVINELKKYSANCFLTDANTLYRGMRHNGKDHRKIAENHGFAKLGLPILIADGDDGKEETEIDIPGRIFNKVRIAKAISDADAIIAVSHFKGHIMCGFGGALKNIGMGCGSRGGKLEMHSKVKPASNKRCTGCGLCAESCQADAITFINGKAKINQNICQGCALCIAVCPEEAISVPWSGATSIEVQNRCAEYALGAVKGKRLVCLTFINNITKDCDCMSDTRIIGNDIGIAASLDPVACDKASYDLTVEKNGGKDIFKAATGTNGTSIFTYSEHIGLGKTDYKLISL